MMNKSISANNFCVEFILGMLIGNLQFVKWIFQTCKNNDNLSCILMIKTWKQRMKQRMEKNGLSMKDLSLKAGLGSTAVYDILKRTSSPSVATLEKISEQLGVTMNFLLYGDDEFRDTIIVGEVGAGGHIIQFDDSPENKGLGSVKTPISFGKVFPVYVRGDSMYPRYLDGDIVAFCKHVRSIDEAYSKECVVRTSDGTSYLKIVRPSHIEGKVTLESHNAPLIQNVELEWAAPLVDWIKRST